MQRTTKTATIASGASLSDAVDVGPHTGIAIHMPASWTTATLTFQVSDDGATYRDLYDIYGTEYQSQAAASRTILLPPSDFAGFQYLKIRSGTSAAAVNQGAARSLIVSASYL